LPVPELVEELSVSVDSTSSEYNVEYDALENKYIIKKRE
jgi:hypothetical protein